MCSTSIEEKKMKRDWFYSMGERTWLQNNVKDRGNFSLLLKKNRPLTFIAVNGGWIRPPPGYVKFNVDGSCLNGKIARLWL